MKFVWCHVKNVVFDSFLSSSSDAQEEWSHSVFLTTVVSCDCCIQIHPYFETETLLVHQLTTEGTVRIETYYSQLTDIHSFVGFFKKCMDEGPTSMWSLSLVFKQTWEVDQRSLFLQALILFLTFTLNPPPPSQKKKKQKTKIWWSSSTWVLCWVYVLEIYITCTSPFFSLFCLTNFCVSLCHIALPLFLYLHEELSLTDDDRLQNPVFLEWPPSPIHSHHPCGLDLQC